MNGMTEPPHRLFAAIAVAWGAIRRAFTRTRRADGMPGDEADTTLFGGLSEQAGRSPGAGPVKNEFLDRSGESSYADGDGTRKKDRTAPRR